MYAMQDHPGGYASILRILHEGTQELVSQLQKIEELHLQSYYAELEHIRGFLDTLNLIHETMPEERLRDTIRNTIKSIRRQFDSIPPLFRSKLDHRFLHPSSGYPTYLHESCQYLGPHFRISANEMQAWIVIGTEENVFYSPESVMDSLKQYSIHFGLQEEKIRELFLSQRYDEEICIALGKPPTKGINGSIQYRIDVDDLGLAPKILETGKVSFKDIQLFAFMNTGEILAEKVPPVPGTPGFTVTNKLLSPPEVNEAEFPRLKNAIVSENGTQLLTTTACCITKKNGQIYVEPSLRVSGNVSYETGNIQSEVAVMVEKDVFTGFSIQSEKDIVIRGIVDGARLESKGNIMIGLGVQGKDKAYLEGNGDISAKFISNAFVTCLGNILVESEIINSKIWVGGSVRVSGKNGVIVGGEIDADSDVYADTIGSEMGVKTIIRMGERISDLATLILENQGKINEQEEAADKCEQVIDVLKQRISKESSPSVEITTTFHKAREILKQARDNLDRLHHENDGLQQQYDESLRLSRTIRVRTTLFPGVVLQILGSETVIKKPTGPVTVVKQGNELVFFPFKEIE